jgi:glutaredoxin
MVKRGNVSTLRQAQGRLISSAVFARLFREAVPRDDIGTGCRPCGLEWLDLRSDQGILRYRNTAAKEDIIDITQMNHVEGTNKGLVIAFTLSTCVWCKRTKRLLDDLGIEYYYVDVDRLEGEMQKQAKDEVKRWNPRGSYPTIVVNNETCITGYDVEEIRRVLGS